MVVFSQQLEHEAWGQDGTFCDLGSQLPLPAAWAACPCSRPGTLLVCALVPILMSRSPLPPHGQEQFGPLTPQTPLEGPRTGPGR